MLSYKELFLLGIDYQTYLAQGSTEENNSVIKIENLLSDMLPKTLSSVKLFEQNKEAYFGGKHLNDTITEILEKLGV